MMKLKYLLSILIMLCLTGWSPFFLQSSSTTAPLLNSSSIVNTQDIESHIRKIRSQADNIDIDVLRLSLKAYNKAKLKGIVHSQLLTVIDYKKSSIERRMWVIDMKKDKVLYNTWVSHGKNSGSETATSFSNQLGSLKSSLGVFLTDEVPYMGGNGYSLRLVGLEPGINDNAYRRNVVIHGAWYASPDVAKKYGQLGRSWGCPAVSDQLVKPIIDTIKHKSLVFVYSRDRKWLNQSSFLTG